MLSHVAADIRFAFRSLRRAPGFVVVAVATLSIGIASVTALFSMVYAYAFRPLPYKDADRIAVLGEHRPKAYRGLRTISLDAARAVSFGARSYERTSLFDTHYSRGTIGEQLVDLEMMLVDSSFTPLFGIRPQLGRTLTADEIAANAPSIIISDQLWRTRFGAEASAVGRKIRIADELVTIVGVMPVGFRYPDRTDLWRPLHIVDSTDATVTLLAKRRREVSEQSARTELSGIARRLAQSDSQVFAGVSIVPMEMIDRKVGGGLPIAGLFVGAAVLVLLIACANVANLLLVRAAERRGEMAVRASLGASRRRLLAQSLTESMIIAVTSGVIGTLLSIVLVRVGLSIIPSAGFPSWLSFGIDFRILGFTMAVVTLVTLGVGITPAREGTRFDLVRALKLGGDGGSAKSGVAKRARTGIIIQLMLSVVLFVGASLFLQSYRKLAVVDVGYAADKIVRLGLYFDPDRFPDHTLRMRFALDVRAQIVELSSVRHAAIRGGLDESTVSESIAVVSTTRNSRRTERPDRRLFVDGDTAASFRGGAGYPWFFGVSNDYFQTLGLRVLRGRTPTSDDGQASAKVIVLSHELADKLWPHQDPIGRTIQFGARGTRIAVIGVVEDVRDIQGGRAGISASPRPYGYLSTDQVSIWNPEVLLTGDNGIPALQAAARLVSRRMDPTVTTVAETMAKEAETERWVVSIFGGLMAGFAVAGLVLSTIGIYGVVAYSITQRTREIGIRLALGGTSSDVLRLVMRQSARFVGVGLLAGIPLSLGAGRLLRVLLFGVATADPLTYAAVCVVFGSVAMLACYLPAQRVTRIEPLLALRSE
jgi:putative ABC transport system permease protein